MTPDPPNENTPSPVVTENTHGNDAPETEIRKKGDSSSPKAAGQRLRDVRQERGLTQAQLAEAIGVTQTAVSRYELGLDTPGGNILQLIMMLLEINYEWYAYGSGPRDRSSRELSREALQIARAIDAITDPKEREIMIRSILAQIAAAPKPK